MYSLAVALFLTAVFLVARVLLRERAWVETQGEVLESSVESITSGSQRLYRGVYLLRYKADRDIREALVRSTASFPTREAALSQIAGHPLGSRWPIHYDPHAPSQVTVTLTLGVAAYAAAIACVLFGLAAAVGGATLWYIGLGPEW